MYAKINGSEEQYNISLSSFVTQHGNTGIRVIGMPETDKGFKVYDGGRLIGDYSEYVYLYNPNEYIKVEETKVEAKGTNAPLPKYDPLASINQRLNKLTPYTVSKQVYIGDTECVFDKVKDGSISARLVTKESEKPCTFDISDGKIVVSFDELEETGTVTIEVFA